MGFSLLELLVAMAVMVLLISVGMPGLQQSSQRIQMEVWSQRLLVLLQQRKAYAMSSNQTVALDMQELVTDLPNGLSLKHNYRAGAPLMFEGVSGFARAGTITLANPGYGVKLIISGLGRIRMCQDSGSQLPRLRLC